MSIFRRRKTPPGSPAGQPASSAAPRKRIAVLGLADINASSAEWSVRSFPWSYAGETSVVADYDVALVNLLDTRPQASFIPRGLSPDIDGEVVFGLLRAASQLLIAGGKIVVLGHPEFCAMGRPPFPGAVGNWTANPEWTGMVLEWEERAGDHVELLVEGGTDLAARFLPYLQLLKRYEYSLIDARPSEHFLRSAGLPPTVGTVGPVDRMLEVTTRQLAKTRRGLAVAWSTT